MDLDSGAMEEGPVVWWVQIYVVQKWWAHQTKNRGRWSEAPIMLSACSTRLLLRSGVAAIDQVQINQHYMSMRHHFHSIGHHSQDLKSIESFWDVLETPTLPSSIQILVTS